MRHILKKNEFRGIGGLGAGIESRNPMDGAGKRAANEKEKRKKKKGCETRLVDANRKQARDPRYRIYARGCDLHSPIGKPHPAW